MALLKIDSDNDSGQVGKKNEPYLIVLIRCFEHLNTGDERDTEIH
jgi:hypothetical protein